MCCTNLAIREIESKCMDVITNASHIFHAVITLQVWENTQRDIVTMAMPTIESVPKHGMILIQHTNYILHENIHVKYDNFKTL